MIIRKQRSYSKNFMINNVKALLFDSGGTLLFSPVSRMDLVKRFAQDNGLDSSRCELAYNRGNQYFLSNYLNCRSADEADCLSDQASFLIGRTLTDDNLVALQMVERMKKKPMMQMYDDVKEALNFLSCMGLTLAVVSNHPRGLEENYRNLNIRHFFKAIIVSGEVGYQKPQNEIYELALSAIGYNAENAIFIGDNLENDYLMPKRLGMEALLIDRKANRNGCIHSLNDLITILGLR